MKEEKLYQLSREVTSPVLISYIEWVLEKAVQCGVSKLYFQARDGYSLIKIAERLCQKKGYAIECRYLYCSRMALRIPSYHLIGDEAFDLLFQYGHHVTLDSFFRRANIPDSLQVVIMKEMGLDEKQRNKELIPSEIDTYKERFRANDRFCKGVMQYSKAAYSDTIAYLEQEHMFECSCVGLVDSGWAGSMQRSLRQLLASAGFQGRIVGFYFGMFSRPKSKLDGKYYTWYFSHNHHLWNKMSFNSHLFECMLSAPHGMTMSYTQTEYGYVPIQAPMPSGKMLDCVSIQLQGILDGVNDFISAKVPERRYIRTAKARLRRLMVCPTLEEVEAYRFFLFCHDVTENAYEPLASQKQLEAIKAYTLSARISRKITRKNTTPSQEPFWLYGTLAYVESPIRREWYRANIWACELIRYLLH